MKIEYLREFIILAKHLNYTTAAKQLHIAQSVLSRHLASLEAQLGVTLLSRNTHGVTLTTTGEFVLEQANRIVNEYDHLCYQITVRKSGIKAAIRIGVPNYAIDDYLRQVPKLMGRLKPDIQLSYVSSDPNEVISELFLDKADVIVVPKFPPPQTMELVYHDLYQERLCVLVSRVNPLAQKKSVSFADLANETFLSVSNNYFLNFWKFVHQLCEESGFEPKEPVLLNQMESALFAVQRNEGIIVVGDHMRKFASEDVAYLELADGNCRRTVSLCYKTGNPIFDDFAKVFLAVFLGQTE